MMINIKPAGYLVVGGQRFVDRVVNSGEVAQEQAAALGRGSRVEPLHPESLVVELAEALHMLGSIIDNMGDLSDALISPVVWANLDCESKLASARALLSRITQPSKADAVQRLMETVRSCEPVMAAYGILGSMDEYAKFAGISEEDQARAILVMCNMVTSGRVKCGEMRQELGEVIPGAVVMGAKAMGISIGEFHASMRDGLIVTDEFLPKFARELSKAANGGGAA